MAYNDRLRTSSIKTALLVLASYALFFLIFFGPVLFSNRVLAPGDGISYFLPSFYSRTMLWDSQIWGGFPSVGDPQRMFWYPPALLLSLIPHSWNLFIVSAYVLAASFTYGYVFSLTRSRLAASISGLIYGLSGFMIAHIGHVAIVHTIAWLPLIVWSYSELAQHQSFNRFWFLIATVAVACALLAGHPQMSTYVLLISACFVLVRGLNATIGTFKFYVVSAASLIIGLCLTAVQTLPTAELAPHTLRASLTFQDFVAYQLPIRQLPVILFPFLYGGSPASFYASPYFGAWPSSADGWGATELTGYVGLMPLILAVVGFVVNRRNVIVWFWGAIAILALVFVLGNSTPLAFIVYRIPVLNLFRAPARHFFAFAFGISVLAGFGVSAFIKSSVSNRLLLKIILITVMTMTVALVSVQLFSGKINELAQQRLGHSITLSPVKNPALLVPIIIVLLSAFVLLTWNQRKTSRLRVALLFLVLVIDLGSSAWFYEWRYRSPYKAFLQAPAAFESYRAQLDANHQRIMPVRGGLGRISELPPNLSKLSNIPSASGYGPFVLTRLNQLLTMQPHGSIDDTWQETGNQSLDLLSVKYVLKSETEEHLPPKTDERGLRWASADSNSKIGPGCDPTTPMSFEIDLPEPRSATRLGIVGTLACSVQLKNGVEFAQLTITSVSGSKEVQSLNAGEHFSEWAWDCSDVRPLIQHERATVFGSHLIERGTAGCEAHDYVAFFPLRQVPDVKKISIRWTGPPATFAIRKISTIDDKGRVSVPVSLAGAPVSDSSRWKLQGKIDKSNSGYGPEVTAEDVGVGLVYENLRVRPRAWLVPEVMRVSEEESINAIRASRLPDGRVFDPARTALIETEPPLVQSGSAAFAGSAQVTDLNDDKMELRTDSNGPAFLITSDLFYPGWQATVDGKQTSIYQADYLLRGVVVPAGTHSVRFEFRPRRFYVGATVSFASLLLLGICCLWRPAKSQKQAEQNH